MRIAGFQPLSLLDYPERIAAVVFTQGCPFRCSYCHNPELLATGHGAKNAAIPTKDVLERIRDRRAFIDGVVVTGGEPTIHPDLPDFLGRVKALGLEVKLDTNGVHPRMIELVIARGLVDFIAMDLKHVWGDYAEIIGRAAPAVIENCRETFDVIRSSGLPREFRTTVYPATHAEADLEEIARELGPGDRYALQDVRYGVTLEKDLPRAPAFDLEAVAARIRAARPGLQVEVRA
ncbi:MAG: anaerobic ribonucleoside-triphosphate reductase activating protein [Patescibacteria group bacterium]